jgi:hypothetical protein
MVVIMATRKDVYEHFGPQLIEALALVIKDEINILRAQHSLPDRSNQQILDAIDAKYSAIGNPLS